MEAYLAMGATQTPERWQGGGRSRPEPPEALRCCLCPKAAQQASHLEAAEGLYSRKERGARSAGPVGRMVEVATHCRCFGS